MAFSLRLGLVCTAALLLLASAAFADAKAEPGSEKYWVFVGTYTGGKSKGIYRFEFDAATGKLSGGELAGEVANPSFLAVHPSRKFLYAVGELNTFQGKKAGAVSAFALDAKTGKLTLLNQQPSGGEGPCHLVVDHEGKDVLAANYGGGSVVCLPVGKDGKLGEATAFIQHKGKGSDPSRQEGPHAHSINVDKNNRFAVACDLGLDKAFVYKFDPEKGTLTANDPPSVDMAPGSGPRHFAFHPSGKFAYAINEMALTIAVMDYDAEKGVLTKKQTISTLPEGADRKGASTAEVQVHPSGKFVYGSNRGHNSIAVFAVDEKTGELKAVQNQGEGIKTPRNFGVDPTGKFLLVANQDGDSIIVFAIDPKTGELKPTDVKVEVGKPVCVKFVPKE
jgi:6-phosphogluconolactonase